MYFLFKPTTIWFVLKIVILLNSCQDASCSQQCRSVNAVPGYSLIGSGITSLLSISFENCVTACEKHSNCYSINHCTASSVCELNNKTQFWSAGNFHIRDDCFYMDMIVRQYDPCIVEQPCKNGATCLLVTSSGTHYCQCRSGFAGKTCEQPGQLSPIGNFTCTGQNPDLCQQHMAAWRVSILRPSHLKLLSCNPDDVINTTELLLFVSRSALSDYGKYEIARVKQTSGCNVTLFTALNSSLSGSPCKIIAQRLPYFDHVTMTQSCSVTCRARSGAVGGILALRANTMVIDSTSRIDVTGKGYRGGAGGSSSGGGGFGGETFACLSANIGKGGDKGQTGNAGGGAGDGSSGGSGGLKAGGGGGDSTTNNDDGGAGGGGGGHFSGGGGGGGGSGCNGQLGGYGGTASSSIGISAGGGGSSSCPGGNGGNGGQVGGNAGTAARGGGGGNSPSSIYGGGGGGGGLQYGNVDFDTRLSYGGGGGGGGGSAFGQTGGRGGHGGGLVLLIVNKLTVNGQILARGESGQCAPTNANHRSAPGGSGAGGSVVIFTNKLVGSVSGKIFVEGAVRKQCALGTGGGFRKKEKKDREEKEAEDIMSTAKTKIDPGEVLLEWRQTLATKLRLVEARVSALETIASKDGARFRDLDTRVTTLVKEINMELIAEKTQYLEKLEVDLKERQHFYCSPFTPEIF